MAKAEQAPNVYEKLDAASEALARQFEADYSADELTRAFSTYELAMSQYLAKSKGVLGVGLRDLAAKATMAQEIADGEDDLATSGYFMGKRETFERMVEIIDPKLMSQPTRTETAKKQMSGAKHKT